MQGLRVRRRPEPSQLLCVLLQKWQRRFFILYEHGLLRYALDEMVSELSTPPCPSLCQASPALCSHCGFCSEAWSFEARVAASCGGP